MKAPLKSPKAAFKLRAEVEVQTWHSTPDYLPGSHEGTGTACGYDPKAREILLFDAEGSPVSFIGRRKVGFDG